MSPSDMSEMDQLEGLAAELAEAGRLARDATAGRQRPEPAFAMRLRADLLLDLPRPAVASGPVPPARPLDAPERLQDRRHGKRPFMGPERRSWTDGLEPEVLHVISATPPDAVDPTRAGKRWAVSDDRGGPARPYGTFDAPLPEGMAQEPDDTGRIVPLKPSMRWHIPTRVLPSRWIAVGLAASVAVASLVYGNGIFTPARTVATADEAAAATLVRAGASSPLIAGTELHEGDLIRTAAAGSATLQVGGSYVRMAGGADVELKSLDPNHVTVNQIDGRVYHRVAVPPGGDYQVQTATVTWKATGTAFDLNRHSTAGGGEQVLGLALYDDLEVRGSGLEESLSEGMSATVVLSADGALAGSPVIEPITAGALAGEWLLANAGLDARLGLPLGRLASLLSPDPTATPPAEPTPTPTPTEQPTEEPTAEPTPAPTPRPTPAPTARPTPKPTATGPANLGDLTIVDNGDGTYSFSWPKYKGSWAGGSQYYKLMHATYPSTPSYGTSGDYWACNTTANDNSWTNSIPAGDYNVRLQVVDESSGKAVIRAQTNVVHLTVPPPATPPPTVDLGPLTIHDDGGGVYTFSWTAYTGGPFSYYKLVFETTASHKTPSYPDGSAYWAIPGSGDTSATLTLGSTNGNCAKFQPGDYQVRIQAIGYPGGHAYAYAQTTPVLNVVVP